MEPWIVGSEPSERFPLWTRANVGEVFPDPVAPLSFTLAMREHTEGAWRDALVEIGAFTHDEFAPGRMETLGVFGSYCYLNASVTRVLGERAPGLSAQAMDDMFFGAQPGIPPYEPAPGDVNEERSAAIGATFQWVMTTDRLEKPAAGAELAASVRAERPDFASMSNEALWAFARDLLDRHFRRLFGEHIFVTFLSTVPVGALSQICEAVGRPEAAMRIISGVGDVESAAPSMATWDLGRMVAGDASLTSAFDDGVDGLMNRLAGAGSAGEQFLGEFRRFIEQYGSRGPREWEVRNHTWETRPELALAAIDRMRLAPDDAAPQQRNAELAAERERLVGEIAGMLEGNPEVRGTFLAAARSAGLFQAGRERTKTNCIKVVHEGRMALHTLGRRLVEQGLCDEVNDFGFVMAEEMEGWLQDPDALRDEIRPRRHLFDQYANLEEPFVFHGEQPDPSTWPRRDEAQLEPANVGDMLAGFPGCPGVAKGTARIVLDPGNPTALGPGEILVAPMTDPSWTPLFVPAAGVIVDVGALQSHAMIVSRELGIPCVPSVTHATRRIPDGATVEVNGDAGTVTILELP